MKSPLPVSLAGRDLLRIADLVPAEIEAMLDLAVELKVDREAAPAGQTLGLFFAQPSTRTRISFSVAIAQLGGTPVTLLPERDAALARRVARGHRRRCSRATSTRSRSARSRTTSSRRGPTAASIPVINALTEVEHPCQALADALTIRERLGGLDGVRVAWVGDGTNVLVSLADARERSPACEVVAACPEGYEPPAGTPLELVRDPREAAARRRRARHRHLGQPRPGGDARRSGCATSSPTASTSRSSPLASPDAIVLHCLPAHPGEEITPRRALRRAARPSGTRPRTACTSRRRCSRCCSARARRDGAA